MPVVVRNHQYMGFLRFPSPRVAPPSDMSEGFIHRGRGRPLNLRSNVAFSEQTKGAASDSNRNTQTGGWGRV